MKLKNVKGVFFDCWDTLISFECHEKRWNILSLEKHCLNHDEIDWLAVSRFSDEFFDSYYQSHSQFEIDIIAVLSLFQKFFGMKLDCPIDVCSHEILCYLDPKPIPGVPEFLSYLDECQLPYYILSNTIYSSEDTLNLINSLIPNHHFGFFLGSKEVGVKKPNPLFFQTGVRLTKLNIGDCMYIGDAFFQDVYGSQQAGFNSSIWLNHKKKSKILYGQEQGKEDNISCVEVNSYYELLKRIKEER